MLFTDEKMYFTEISDIVVRLSVSLALASIFKLVKGKSSCPGEKFAKIYLSLSSSAKRA